MPNYKSMYLDLFNVITDSITILQQAQCRTEEIAMQEYDNSLCIAPKQNKEDI